MIQLNDDLSLVIEKDNSKARLVIYKQADEFVCRKSSLSQLKELLYTDNTHLFKGRLQLYRDGNDIAVEVKGKEAGSVNINEFKQLLAL